MSAPSEAEIRQAIDVGKLNWDNWTADALCAIADSDMARVRAVWDRDFHPSSSHPGTLWADLRPSEVDDLTSAIETAIAETKRHAAAELAERVVSAALYFGTEHPDAARGHWAGSGSLVSRGVLGGKGRPPKTERSGAP